MQEIMKSGKDCPVEPPANPCISMENSYEMQPIHIYVNMSKKQVIKS